MKKLIEEFEEWIVERWEECERKCKDECGDDEECYLRCFERCEDEAVG